MKKTERVKVVVRCRPLNSREQEQKEYSIIEANEERQQIRIQKPNGSGSSSGSHRDSDDSSRLFTFDRVFAPGCTQQQVYEQTGKPIVESVLEGYNGTIFAYGQTGTGKTYTMEGAPGNEGIMPQSFAHILNYVDNSPDNEEFLVRASFLEIYKEQVYDLLNRKARKKMAVKQHPTKGVFVQDLQHFLVKSTKELLKIMNRGQKARAVGATSMNPGSSRSHSILTVTVESSYTSPEDSEKPEGDGGDDQKKGKTHYKVGKLNLVDLAGSERQKRTQATGNRLDEAKSINRSLTTLGSVIKALVSKTAQHVPFRDSKLTRLLQDSLGGNTKTCMIANIGPSDKSYEETLSTLRYADRAKQIKNAPRINEDPKDALLRQYRDEIERLKAELHAKKNGMTVEQVLAMWGKGGSKPGAASVSGPTAGPQSPEVVEQVVEVEKVVDTGLTEEDLRDFHQKSKEEQAAIRAQLAQQLNQDRMSQEEAAKQKQLLASKLEQKAEEARKRADDLFKIEARLKNKQTQLMRGGKQLDGAARKLLHLKKMKKELAQRKDHEEKLKQLEDEQREEEEELRASYATLEEERVAKKNKLKSLIAKMGRLKTEREDLEAEWEAERADLLQELREDDRELKLTSLLMDYFIPAHYIDVLEESAYHDPGREEWIIPGLQYSLNAILTSGDPVLEDHLFGVPEAQQHPGMSHMSSLGPEDAVDLQMSMRHDDDFKSFADGGAGH